MGRSLNPGIETCPVCGGHEFATDAVLWPELIQAWELSAAEAAYIDLQQGLHCVRCRNSLRSMTLATAVKRAFGFSGTFEDFCRVDSRIRQCSVVEINSAGTLSPFLKSLPGHAPHSFPDIDLQQLGFSNGSIDVIIHSDTLEHVPDSMAALRECHRVLKGDGHLFYTVPIVIGRLTRKRDGLPPSYHGRPQTARDDYIVQTEYGADFWCEIFAAGFKEVSLTSLIFPASVAISARKT